MNTDEKIKLWQYTELKPLSGKAVLVRNNFSGKLMIKHLANTDSFYVFETLKNLSSPYLMQIYDSVIENNMCISLCEYIEEVTLENVVERIGTYPEKSVRKIIVQLCEGLSVLHKNGIIHRDINPTNVMIDTNGNIKIIDFDITRTVKSNQSSDTRILGTPGYASPEQFGFDQTDQRADIYSCGALMNYLLTGMLPNEKLHRGSLSAIIKKCIELDPENRFSDVDELKKALLGRIKDINAPKEKRKYINHSRPPGFKTGNPAAKFFTILFYIAYFILLAAYLNFSFHGGYEYERMKGILIGLTVFVFLTGLPYLSFGDVGGISRFIVRNHPAVGKFILTLIGIASLCVGFYFFSAIPNM